MRANRSLLLPVLFCSALHAKGGIDATELQPVALDSSVPCNRVFFRSSQYYKNTIFRVPRVAPGKEKNIYDVFMTEDGRYRVILKLYFPRNDELLKGTLGSTLKKDSNSCNPDIVKQALNKHAKDDEKVYTIADLPLTSIDVAMPGINQVARIGHLLENDKDVDVLDYYGNTEPAEFTLTPREFEIFQRQIRSKNGMLVAVRFRFQAKQRDGSVHAEVDMSQVSANFEANLKGAKAIAKGELSARLAAATDKKSIKIEMTQGSTGTVEGWLNKITDKLLADLKLEVQSLASKSASECPELSATDLVCAKVVMELLSSKATRTFDFENIGAPETATAQTAVKFIVTRLIDPRIAEIEVQAGYEDPSTPFSIHPGQTITIAPAYEYTENINYYEDTYYMSSAQMKDIELYRHFPDITDSRMVILDHEYNGFTLAEGEYASFTPKWFFWWAKYPTTGVYRWLRTVRYPGRSKIGENKRIEQTPEAWATLPVAVSFTGLNDRKFIPFAELLKGDACYSAYYDAYGRIVLTAANNPRCELGSMKFRELMDHSKDLSWEPKTLDEVTEQFITPLYTKTVSNEVLVRDTEAYTKQRTIVMYVSMPEVLNSNETPIPPTAAEVSLMPTK